MDQLRAITDNINVFVRFFESLNCLIFQLQWLKQHVLHTSTDILIIALIVLVIVAYVMISCSEFICDGTIMEIPIFFMIFCILLWFLYKRCSLRVESNASSHANFSSENEKFIGQVAATVPSAEVYYGYDDREAGMSMEPITKRH